MGKDIKYAIEMALFFRRSAHKRRRLQRLLMPEWNGQDNFMSYAANQDLRQAIKWIQTAKYRMEKLHG